MVKFVNTKAEFDEEMSNSGNKLVVVDFTASWCGPCKHIAPVFERLAKENPGVVFFKVDVDENEETSIDQGISCMPTFKFYKYGEVVDMIEGASESDLVEKIQKLK